MAKNKQILMGLELVSQNSGFEAGTGSLVPARAGSEHLADKQEMGCVLDLRLGAVKSTGIATRQGMDEMVKIAQHAAVKFSETAAAFSQLKQKAEDMDYGEYVTKLNEDLFEVVGQQLIQSTQVGGRAIAFEMVGDPYPPPPLPPPEPEWEPTGLGRLFIRKKRNR